MSPQIWGSSGYDEWRERQQEAYHDARFEDAYAQSRPIADGLILDALISFVAIMRESEHADLDGAALVGAFAEACRHMSDRAKELLTPDPNVVRYDGEGNEYAAPMQALATRDSLIHSLWEIQEEGEDPDERIEMLIQERAALIRKTRSEREPE
jgi:hypothetical protein